MKRLIKQLLLFISFPIALLVIIFIFLNYTYKNQIENYKFDAKINKIVVGSSNTHTAINDKFLNNTKNISQNSECFMYSFFKLQTLLKNNHQIDTVFLGVNYFNFSAYCDEYIFVPAVTSRYFFILPNKIQFYLLKNTFNLYQLIKTCLIKGVSNLKNTSDKFTYLYESEDLSTKVPLSDKTIEKTIKKQYCENGKLYDYSNSNIYYFMKIKELCKNNNITLILLSTPLHSKYKALVPLKFIYLYNFLTKDFKKNLIEFDGLKLNDNDFLPDGDHLSASGAKTASEYLNELLKVK